MTKVENYQEQKLLTQDVNLNDLLDNDDFTENQEILSSLQYESFKTFFSTIDLEKNKLNTKLDTKQSKEFESMLKNFKSEDERKTFLSEISKNQEIATKNAKKKIPKLKDKVLKLEREKTIAEKKYGKDSSEYLSLKNEITDLQTKINENKAMFYMDYGIAVGVKSITEIGIGGFKIQGDTFKTSYKIDIDFGTDKNIKVMTEYDQIPAGILDLKFIDGRLQIVDEGQIFKGKNYINTIKYWTSKYKHLENRKKDGSTLPQIIKSYEDKLNELNYIIRPKEIKYVGSKRYVQDKAEIESK